MYLALIDFMFQHDAAIQLCPDSTWIDMTRHDLSCHFVTRHFATLWLFQWFRRRL